MISAKAARKLLEVYVRLQRFFRSLYNERWSDFQCPKCLSRNSYWTFPLGELIKELGFDLHAFARACKTNHNSPAFTVEGDGEKAQLVWISGAHCVDVREITIALAEQICSDGSIGNGKRFTGTILADEEPEGEGNNGSPVDSEKAKVLRQMALEPAQ